MDLAVLVIFFFILVVFSIVMFMSSGRISTALHDVLDTESTAEENYTTMLDNSITATHNSLGVLKWLMVFLFLGFAIVLWLSAWMVNTHPVFFLIYIIAVIITIIFGVGLSNVYEMMSEQAGLTSTIGEFSMLGYLMAYLPIWISVIGFIGLIIMFVRFKKGGESYEML